MHLKPLKIIKYIANVNVQEHIFLKELNFYLTWQKLGVTEYVPKYTQKVKFLTNQYIH